jgi:hypothetical protein
VVEPGLFFATAAGSTNIAKNAGIVRATAFTSRRASGRAIVGEPRLMALFDGAAGGGAQSGIPQVPPQSQQHDPSARSASNATGCTCTKAVHQAARRSQTIRFMPKDFYV